MEHTDEHISTEPGSCSTFPLCAERFRIGRHSTTTDTSSSGQICGDTLSGIQPTELTSMCMTMAMVFLPERRRRAARRPTILLRFLLIWTSDRGNLSRRNETCCPTNLQGTPG